MKKHLFILLIFGFFQIQAQIKVGKNAKNINPSSVLEMESDSMGMLLPRVSLISLNSFFPLKSHVAGMVVYNLGTAGVYPNNVIPGFYYNDGYKWVLIGNATGIAKLEDVTLNNNAFRFININNDTVVINKVLQNILTYEPNSKQLITSVNGVKDTVVLNVEKFDTTHVYAKIKLDSAQFAQKVDSVYVNTKGDSVFVKDGYGATTGYKLAQFDTTHVYAKIKLDSTQFAQKVDSVYVNAAGDSVFVKDGYGATTGYKLSQFDTTHVYAKIKSDSLLFKNKVDSVYLNTAGDSLFVIDQQYGSTSSYKLATPIARNGLSKSGDTIILGGSLTQNTIITNSGKSLTYVTNGDSIKFTGLLNGKITDSLLVIDSASSTLRKIATNQLTALSLRVVTGSTTITLADYTIVLNSTSAATFTLPAANSAKDKIFRITNHAYFSGQDITLSIPVKYGTGTSTSVDDMYVGGGFYTSSTVSTILIQSDGTSWWFIGR